MAQNQYNKAESIVLLPYPGARLPTTCRIPTVAHASLRLLPGGASLLPAFPVAALLAQVSISYF